MLLIYNRLKSDAKIFQIPNRPRFSHLAFLELSIPFLELILLTVTNNFKHLFDLDGKKRIEGLPKCNCSSKNTILSNLA